MNNAPETYEDLLEVYTATKSELEVANQKLYECQRELKVEKAVGEELKEQIQCDNEDKERLSASNLNLKSTINTLKEELNKKTSEFDEKIDEQDKQIAELKNQLEELRSNQNKPNFAVDETLINELGDLKQKNEDLLINIEAINVTNEELVNSNKILQEKLNQLNEELSDVKEVLAQKKEQLDEANSLIQNIKDDNLCLKSELDSVKSKPLDHESKGNSIFAEVDDRRVKLQQNMKVMKEQYLTMKRERSMHLEQIQSLRRENAILIAKLKNETAEKQDEEQGFNKEHKVEVKGLKDIIDSLQKQLKEKETMLEKIPDMAKATFLITRKDKEIEEIRQKYFLKISSVNSLYGDCVKANREIRQLKVEILELENKIADKETNIKMLQNEYDELKMSYEELKIKLEQNEIENKPEVKKSILKNVENLPSIDLTNDEDDCNKKTRKLMFSEDVVEPKITDRTELKKSRLRFVPSIKAPSLCNDNNI